MPSATCRADCTVPTCGDGIVDTTSGEGCDEGTSMPSATCRADCIIPTCGDNVVDEGENCDEGTAMPSGTCRADCTIPTCGDGVLDAGEDCDSGPANGNDGDGCRDDCTVPSCGDGIVDSILGEVCDEGDAMPSETCVSCAVPKPDVVPVCGDGNVDTDLGEQCDEGDAMPSATCRADCTIPSCGDGVVDDGEECDMGADNGLSSSGCKADCTTCICGAEATYDASTGGVTIDFDMCGAQALESDFVGIYPCDEVTKVGDQDWWNNTVCRQFPAACGEFQFGYEENKTYVGNLYKWFSWTCGSPEEGGCQTNGSTVWPDSGTLVLDPNQAGSNWAFLGGRTLEPGCYKAILQREMYFISPPPYPDICEAGWGGALEFNVPDPSGTEVSPLETDPSAQSGTRSARTTFFVSMISILALYFVI